MASADDEPIRHRLNSLVTWHAMEGPDRLQVRFPNGDHITFDSHVGAISKLLEALSRGEEPESDPVSEEMVSFLHSRSVLMRTQPAAADWMVDAIDHLLKIGSSASGSNDLQERLSRTRVAVDGTGWLASVAWRAVELAGMLPTGPTGQDVGLSLAVADASAFDAFSRANRDSFARGVSSAFLWRDFTRIYFGPLVLPGQSACFECYRTRIRASAAFRDEFDAISRDVPSAREPRATPLAEGAALSFIARQLVLSAAELYDQLEPATVYGFDVVTLLHTRTPVPRVARCTVCGGGRRDVSRAVRMIP